MFVASIFFAYLLMPLVDLTQRRLQSLSIAVPTARLLALGLVYIVLAFVAVVCVGSIGSVLVDQASVLAKKIPNLLSAESAQRLPIPEVLRPYGERVAELLRHYVQEHSQELLLSFSRAGADVVGAAFSLVMVIILPILSFYCLKDGRLLSDKLLLVRSALRNSLCKFSSLKSRVLCAVVGARRTNVARRTCHCQRHGPAVCVLYAIFGVGMLVIIYYLFVVHFDSNVLSIVCSYV